MVESCFAISQVSHNSGIAITFTLLPPNQSRIHKGVKRTHNAGTNPPHFLVVPNGSNNEESSTSNRGRISTTRSRICVGQPTSTDTTTANENPICTSAPSRDFGSV